jgi:hypothetical protein
MARFTNKKPNVGGGEGTSEDEIAALGLTEGKAAVDDDDDDTVPIGAPTIFTGRNYKYPARAIELTPANIRAIQDDKTYDPDAPSAYSRVVPKRNVVYYEGPQLVDVDRLGNKFIRPGSGYAADGSDINTEYFSITNKDERAMLLSTAQKLGFYGDRKPSPSAVAGTGLQSYDGTAIQMLFNYSVGQGVTWRNLAMQVASGRIPPVTGGGSGRIVRVTSTADVKTSIYDAFFTALGRPPTPEQIKVAVAAVQAEERKAGMGDSFNATSLRVASREQAAKAAPAEAGAVSGGSALDRIFRLIGGA